MFKTSSSLMNRTNWIYNWKGNFKHYNASYFMETNHCRSEVGSLTKLITTQYWDISKRNERWKL